MQTCLVETGVLAAYYISRRLVDRHDTSYVSVSGVTPRGWRFGSNEGLPVSLPCDTYQMDNSDLPLASRGQTTSR